MPLDSSWDLDTCKNYIDELHSMTELTSTLWQKQPTIHQFHPSHYQSVLKQLARFQLWKEGRSLHSVLIGFSLSWAPMIVQASSQYSGICIDAEDHFNCDWPRAVASIFDTTARHLSGRWFISSTNWHDRSATSIYDSITVTCSTRYWHSKDTTRRHVHLFSLLPSPSAPSPFWHRMCSGMVNQGLRENLPSAQASFVLQINFLVEA